MVREEFKDGGLHAAVAQAMAKPLGREAGQREKTFGALLVGQRPAKRFQRENLRRPICSIRRFIACVNCQCSC